MVETSALRSASARPYSLEQALKGSVAKSALNAAKQLYGTQKHWMGMSIVDHVTGTAKILMPFGPDEQTLAACFLQHALTNGMTAADIEERFGEEVRHLVHSIHLLSHVTSVHSRSSIEDLRLMLLRVTDDLRILVLLLCKRSYMLEHMDSITPAQRKSMSNEALALFAPVASRLGIHSLKQHIEGLAFPVMYPADHERIMDQLTQVHTKYGLFLPAAALKLQKLLAEQGITATVYGREKHPYSLFMKMKSKSLTHIESLYDLYALRIVVKTVDECYQTLGLLHRMGRPIGTKFKDFIALPKPNGYQSLHTTMAKLPGVPDGLYVEVQVRTESMHREAELGVAAHWSYKEGGTAERTMRRAQLQQMLSSQLVVEGEGKTASGLAEHIVILTPKGDIIELPEGSTPLDFAFQIHSDLGLRFKSARVNGRIVSLDYVLENGDVVDIVAHKTPNPSPSWMQLLKTASSRSRLRRYLQSLHKTEYAAQGKVLLNKELTKSRLPVLDTDLGVLRKYKGKTLTQAERQDLLSQIGEGSLKASVVVLDLNLVASFIQQKPPATVKKKPRMQRKDSLIETESDFAMPLKFAKCCKPQDKQGTPIIGLANRAGEVSIHLSKCKMIKRANPGRRVKVWWRK